MRRYIYTGKCKSNNAWKRWHNLTRVIARGVFVEFKYSEKPFIVMFELWRTIKSNINCALILLIVIIHYLFSSGNLHSPPRHSTTWQGKPLIQWVIENTEWIINNQYAHWSLEHRSHACIAVYIVRRFTRPTFYLFCMY